ncbi:MAG: hypothetical protein ACREMB_23960 [Candidatus Rokuibacteriota bacterium]
MYGKPLPNWSVALFPTDTRSIISAVFLALGFTVTMQIGERIDAAYGGLAPLVAIVIGTFWFASGSMFYGIVGALIVSWVNPVVANLTATGPLAPLWFTVNPMYNVPLALFVRYFKPPDRGLRFWEFQAMNMVCGLLAMVTPFIAYLMFLNLTLAVAVFWVAAAMVSFFVSGFVTFPILRKMLDSGLIATAVPDEPRHA